MGKKTSSNTRPAARIVKKTNKSPEELKAAFMAGCDAEIDLKGFKKKERVMLYALKLTKGNVTEASKMVGLSRRTFYNYALENQDFADLMDDYQYEVNTDMVISQLLRRCELGSDSSIRYYLENQGKKRGFGNTLKIEGGTRNINYNVPLTDEEVKAYAKALEEDF